MPEKIPEYNQKNVEHLKRDIRAEQEDPTPPHIKEITVEGHTVRMVGVFHTAANYEKYKDIYLKEIQNADLLVLEGTPEQHGFNFEEEAKKREERGLSKEDFNILYKEGGIGFFETINKVAHQHGKQVACVDPVASIDLSREILNRDLDDGAFNLDLHMAEGGASFLSLELMVHIVNKMKEQKLQRQGVPQSAPSNSLSRRDFLRMAGKGLAAMAVLPIINRTVESLASIAGDSPDLVANLELLIRSVEDYRNLVVSEGVDRLAKRYPDKTITMIYGAKHLEPVEKYATKDVLRQAKFPFYTEFTSKMQPALSVYQPNQEGWQETVHEAIEGVKN